MTVDTKTHPSLPPPASRPWLACAAVCWVLAVLGDGGIAGPVLAGAVVFVSLLTGHPWVAVAALAITASATLSTHPVEPLQPGRVVVTGTMTTDVIEGRFGPWAMVLTDQGPLLIDLEEGTTLRRGDVITVEGRASGGPGVARGEEHRWVVRTDTVEVVGNRSSPILAAGEAVRSRVLERLQPSTPGRALLTGFLIGDTEGLDRVDIDAMRKSGLAHFTAVSGRNVALFLGLLYAAAGPLGLGPKRRAVLGLVGLPIYAAATAFTPSVLRASVMAGMALAGRLVGVVLESWQLLSLAVVVLLIAEPSMTSSVGLQLSVAGTAGVLLGARWPLGRGLIRRALAVTVGAQLAVAPLLLIHFGTVPLAAPLANLFAAPLVAAAAVTGAVGVAGPAPLADLGAWFSELVLAIAHAVQGWPQLGPIGLIGVMAVAVVFARYRPARGAIALAGAGLALVTLFSASTLPSTGAVVFDVGQGDAILLVGGEGRFALFDAGPDPLVIHQKLKQHGIRSLDLVVLSHVHADHIDGFTGLAGRIPIGLAWDASPPHRTPSSDQVLAALARHQVPVERPAVGQTFTLGHLHIEVVGPQRRYESPNDQSIVLRVTGPARTMLLTGDIEEVAQHELMGITADVLQVPHHGAATSSPRWLSQVGARLAFVSVGENDFGHPAEWVITSLEESGATVLRTDVHGDVVVNLD